MFRRLFKDLTPDSMRSSDEIRPGSVLILMGDNLKEMAADYRWMCERFVEERFHFVRHKKYRCANLQEAIDTVYSNASFMSRYVNGMLFSQICWRNHAAAMDLFRRRFLPANRDAYDHLEVGPGHGLFLVFAARDARRGQRDCMGSQPFEHGKHSRRTRETRRGKRRNPRDAGCGAGRTARRAIR